MESLLYHLLAKLVRVALILFVAAFIGILVMFAVGYPIQTDEVVFYNITRDLPSYSATSEWANDRDLQALPKEYWDTAYDIPVWHHPPLGPLIAWPLVKLGADVIALRGLMIVLFMVALWLIYRVIEPKVGLVRAVLCFFPIVALPYAMLGIAFVYHQIFMVVFLAWAIYLADRKSSWVYVAAIALCWTKAEAFIFLIPIALWAHNWKIAICILSLTPYWIYSWLVTGNPLYLATHWVSVAPVMGNVWSVTVLSNISNYLLRSGLWLFLPLVIGAVWRTRHMHLAVLGIINVVLVGYIASYTHMPQMLLSIPLMMASILQGRKHEVPNSIASRLSCSSLPSSIGSERL